MTASRELGAIRAVPEESLKLIDREHELIEEIMRKGLAGAMTDEGVKLALSQCEFSLQCLWGFPLDASFHTYWKLYQFRKQWAGRTFECTETGQTFKIPPTCRECDFYAIGQGYIDLGRLGAYSRQSGIKEIQEC